MSHVREILFRRFKVGEDARKERGEPFKYMELACDGPDCTERIRATDEATALGFIIHKAYNWTIGEAQSGPDYCWLCTQRKNFLHHPMRTRDGHPAHGCEVCDGEDVCTCGRGARARCTTCGGAWPDCMRQKKKES
jgi:hypothetical protein